jgi:hypothetical protein
VGGVVLLDRFGWGKLVLGLGERTGLFILEWWGFCELLAKECARRDIIPVARTI